MLDDISFNIFKLVDLIFQISDFTSKNKAFLLFSAARQLWSNQKGTELRRVCSSEKGCYGQTVIWHYSTRRSPSSPTEGLPGRDCAGKLQQGSRITGQAQPLAEGRPDPRGSPASCEPADHQAVTGAGCPGPGSPALLPDTCRSSPRRRGRCGAPGPRRLRGALPGPNRALPGRGEKAEVLRGWCRWRAPGCSLMVCGGCRPPARSLQAQYGDGGGSRPGETARSDPAQFLHLQPQAGAQRGRGTGGGCRVPGPWGEEGTLPAQLCPGLGCRRGPRGGCLGSALPPRGLGRGMCPRD